MSPLKEKIRIGIVGCGAIGSRLAQSTKKELKDVCRLMGLYDIDTPKATELQNKLGHKGLVKKSLASLINSCDLLVEAVASHSTSEIIRQALLKKKDVLAMSVGQLLNADDIFSLATKNRCSILLPSGAIAGIDAIKAASLGTIKKITLTTRKPISGFAHNPYIQHAGIQLDQIKKETVIFEGDVKSAISHFPQNINVAATIALASQTKDKLVIRIITSPKYKANSHEIEVISDSGRIFTRSENVICDDNPKTSYLAVLSSIQTLKDFCYGIKIGT